MSDDFALLDLGQFASLADAVAAVMPARRYEEIAVEVLEACNPRLTPLVLFFMSAVTRARCLHEGIASAIESENPHAAFPLIRQFAESVAVVLYVADHPDYVEAIMDHPRNHPAHVKRKSIQALVNYMDAKHSRQFGIVYADLCEITHYGSFAWATPFRTPDDGSPGAGRLDWHSGPRWKDERQGLIACAQTLELVEAMCTALHNVGGVCVRAAQAAKESRDKSE